MPIKNRIAAFQNEMVEWRHHFHEHPELAYKVQYFKKSSRTTKNLALLI